ncbi:MAG: homoserine dehydrogenase [Methanomassiliicoccales archaeon]|nr:homoserine dehydrogenase [Methanomassiliicoccales archaeon]
MDLFIAGFGVIGQGVVEVIQQKGEMLSKAFGQRLRVVGVCDSSSYETSKRGLDPSTLIRRKLSEGKVGTKPFDGDAERMLGSVDYDTLIEVTPTNIQNGEPGVANMLTALNRGKHVVTSNKGPLALRFKELSRAAEKNGVQLRFEATVGGATPIINLSRELLRGEKILSIRGILNGTCNFILNRMKEEGLPFAQALREAQDMGIAERDPSYDIDGVDSACKAAILANAIFHLDRTYSDVKRTGIRGVTEEAVSLASEEKKVIRLIGEISSKRLEVAPRLVPIGHPLSIGGTRNIVQIHTDLAGEITVAGRGAGKFETASAILSDLVALLKDNQK